MSQRLFLTVNSVSDLVTYGLGAVDAWTQPPRWDPPHVDPFSDGHEPANVNPGKWFHPSMPSIPGRILLRTSWLVEVRDRAWEVVCSNFNVEATLWQDPANSRAVGGTAKISEFIVVPFDQWTGEVDISIGVPPK